MSFSTSSLVGSSVIFCMQQEACFLVGSGYVFVLQTDYIGVFGKRCPAFLQGISMLEYAVYDTDGQTLL